MTRWRHHHPHPLRKARPVSAPNDPPPLVVNIHGILYPWTRDGIPGTPTTPHHWYRLLTPGTMTHLAAATPTRDETVWWWKIRARTYAGPAGYPVILDGSQDTRHDALLAASKALRNLHENIILWGAR